MSRMSEIMARPRTVPEDIQRILGIPRRSGSCPDFTPYLKTPSGGMLLRPIQNEMLWQASLARGLLGLVGVGEGKTLASFLMPRVLKAERPLLLLPASMRLQAQADWGEYGQHFHLPPQMEMRSYEEISTQPGLLRQLQPDLIVADEVHKLKNPTSTRTRRLKNYFAWCVRNNKTVPMFVGLSGSITSTTVKDFWHLSLWALKENTPLPIKWPYLESWGAVLDKGKNCENKDMSLIAPLLVQFKTADPREAFKENLLTTRGVVISHKAPPPCELKIFNYTTKMPKEVRGKIQTLNDTWQTPQGEELDSALALVRVRRQMICGFYYYWDWPGDPDEEWMDARSEWAKACRTFCSRAPEGIDTPALVERAVIRFLRKELEIKLPRGLVMAYIDWAKVKDRPLPPVGVKWFSQYFLAAIINWVKTQKEPPLIWYEHTALAHALGQITGWPIYGTGKAADEALTQVTEPHVALISIRSHSQGKNLQAWGNHFIAHPLSDGARWEQLLGRSHRHGQKRKAVTVTVPNYDEFSVALQSARLSARYIEDSTGLKQRLLNAEWV